MAKDVAAIVAAAAESRGIGYQGQLVSSDELLFRSSRVRANIPGSHQYGFAILSRPNSCARLFGWII